MWFWAATWLHEWLEPRARSGLFVMHTASLSYHWELQAASPIHKTVRETNCTRKSADRASLCPFTCNWYWRGTPRPRGAPEPNIGYGVSVWEVCLVKIFMNIRGDNTFYRNAYRYLLHVLFVLYYSQTRQHFSAQLPLPLSLSASPVLNQFELSADFSRSLVKF